jgi:UDPglucose 6-dehydrogenase
MRLGLVGHGFVGSAINQGFTKNIKKFIVDPKYYRENTMQGLIEFDPDFVFVAVPTPQSDTGECNTEILFSVIHDLNRLKGKIIIIKSTVPAYILKQLNDECIDIHLVYNPEFLTERNYIQDFKNPAMHVFGGEEKYTKQVEELYKNHSNCNSCPVYHTDVITASMVKYSINSYLATKVTFFNELHDVYNKAGGKDFRELTEIISTDPRIGKTHMQVPGLDGSRGYAGSCFPKDTSALCYFAREILNTPLTQLETSIGINKELRKRDSQ